MPVITELNIYPVKSLKGMRLDHAQLSVRGLEFDRQWMITNSEYQFLTQRELPGMATIAVDVNKKELILDHESTMPLHVNLNHAETRHVTAVVWQDTCDAVDEGDEAAGWLTSVLGNHAFGPLRLVRMTAGCKRQVETDHLNGVVSYTWFSDAYPYLVCSSSSLEVLNNKLDVAVPMSRFRPNIVLDDLGPFMEHTLKQLVSDGKNYSLGLSKACQRCKVTTINQDDGSISNPKEPLKTLTAINQLPGQHGAYFGQNAILLEGEGQTINVGDNLRAI